MKGQRITVVVAPLSAYADNTVLPPYAEAELATVTDPQAAAEKRAGYGLLLAMGVEVRECTRLDRGKPHHPACFFSVTHKAGTVAVAVGGQPLGLDIEPVDGVRQPARLLDRIGHPQETETDAALLWTRKEAVFKYSDAQTFCPSAIDTTAYSTVTRRVTVAGREYYLTLCADDLSDVRWIEE